MTYKIVLSNSAKKSLKKLKRSGSFNPDVFNMLLLLLAEGKLLPERYQDHQLHGEFVHFRECHLGFNLLVVYRRNDECQVVAISDIGTHPELFGE